MLLITRKNNLYLMIMIIFTMTLFTLEDDLQEIKNLLTNRQEVTEKIARFRKRK